MSKDIQEAIETMQHWIEYEKANKDKINKADELIEIQETVLNYIKTLKKENEEKSIAIICYQEDLENSIPKVVIEEKIDRFKDTTVWGYNDWKYDEKVYKAELNIIDRIKKDLLANK